VSYRCINAFTCNNLTYPGGALVEDTDPILSSHSAHFVKVADPVVATETATAAPAERRTVELGEPKSESKPHRGRPRKQSPAVEAPTNPAPEAPAPEGE
jgi:hypothetical protein